MSVRVRLEVCLPFPQSQLCTGSWPHCPTVRRQRCEGWLRSSPGSLSPVEAEEGWKTEKDTLKVDRLDLNTLHENI